MINNRKNLILACGALAHDLIRLLGQNPILSNVIKIQCLPAKLHNTPELIAKEVDNFLAIHAKQYQEVFVAYGDCGTAGALDIVLKKYQAQRLPGAHCYEFFAGKNKFNELMEKEIGSFFVTDYLVKNFERLVIASLKLDVYPELRDTYFRHYKKLVYLAQEESLELKNKAKKHANELGLEFDYHQVGIEGLLPAISDFNNIENHVSV